jgi:tRNA A-37 threonylcarbamoyl transferase component Bud32
MPELDNLAQTIIYSPPSEQPESSLRGRVALVESAVSGAPDEVLLLLRQRLRLLCGILLGGFSVFFLRQIATSGIDMPMRWNWAVIFPALAASSAMLLIPRRPTRAWIDSAQALMFGGAAWFFAATMHVGVSRNQVPEALPWAIFELMSGIIWFCVLASTYGTLFVGTWRRMAWAVPLWLAIPAAVMLYDRHHFPAFATAVNTNMVTVILMTLATCGGAIVLSAYRLSQLQREAAVSRKFGQYRLKKKIGAGGMGEVYLAEHTLLKRPCAIKRIRPGNDNDPVTLARFEREVRATAELSHPHTVEIYDYGRAGDGTFYYVMEYLWGLSLEDLVNRSGPLPAARVVFLLSQVCEALEEAHANGLIHRDLKPGNIFAARRGGRYDFVKLLDFGLVKSVERPDDPTLSRQETVVGSPMYMAPEQFGGETPDARADVYSMGGVAYFLLTGRPPFVGPTSYEIMIAHARDPVAPPSQIVKSVPPDVEAIVLRCLAKDPSERFQSASSLAEALAECAVAGQWTHADAARWWQAHRDQEDKEFRLEQATLPVEALEVDGSVATHGVHARRAN